MDSEGTPMADIYSVIPKIEDALNEALDVAQLPRPSVVIAGLQAQVDLLNADKAALTAANVALQLKIDAAKAALA
jgi:hypothetical protein